MDVPTAGRVFYRHEELTEAGSDMLADALPRWEKAQAEVIEAMGENRWRSTLASLQQIPALFPLESTTGAATPATDTGR